MDNTLYVTVQDGCLTRVSVYCAPGAREMTADEAETYVRGGCPALAERLGVRLPVPE